MGIIGITFEIFIFILVYKIVKAAKTQQKIDNMNKKNNVEYSKKEMEDCSPRVQEYKNNNEREETTEVDLDKYYSNNPIKYK